MQRPNRQPGTATSLLWCPRQVRREMRAGSSSSTPFQCCKTQTMPCRARSPETAQRAPPPAAHTMPPGRARRPENIPTLPKRPPQTQHPAKETRPTAHNLLRVQGYLLHAPVVHVSHKYRVLGRASQSMRPVELAHTMARLPEHAENLAVQRHLVEPTRRGVDDEQILGRSRRDARGPRG